MIRNSGLIIFENHRRDELRKAGAKALILFLVVFGTTSMMTCSKEGESMVGNFNHQDSNESENLSVALQKIGEYKIYFGHKSVGYNIVNGLSTINEETGEKLLVKETKDVEDFSGPIFAHFQVGQNTEPVTKIRDFSSQITGGIGEVADFAFFKFCYIDFNKNTDIEQLFSVYESTMEQLKMNYPNVTFIHITTPLAARERGLKTVIKRMLGRDLWGYRDNVVRGKYNRLIRDRYSGKEPIFDLARIESLYPDGKTRLSHEWEGQKYYSLVPDYTDDGGHLNRVGRLIVAEELIKFLNNILSVTL